MITSSANTLFQKYGRHVLSWEGGLSKDPDDTAAVCAPFPGAYHTNKGVTYCTFTKLAGSLGIPVTYQAFTRLTGEQVSRFIFHYFNSIGGPKLPDSVALSVTEATWGSGPDRAVRHLQQALRNLGSQVVVNGKLDSFTIALASQQNELTLFLEYWKERRKFIDSLTAQAKYRKYKNGWNNRIEAFLSQFTPTGGLAGMLAALLFFFM